MVKGVERVAAEGVGKGNSRGRFNGISFDHGFLFAIYNSVSSLICCFSLYMF